MSQVNDSFGNGNELCERFVWKMEMSYVNDSFENENELSGRKTLNMKIS